MSTSAASPGAEGPVLGTSEARDVARDITGYWWLWLVTGVAWIVAALVVLQFDQASIATIGIITGCMLVFAGFQQFALAAVGARYRWLPATFGVLFVAAGIVCFVNPENTFAGLADILGFIFLLIGVSWTISAFAERDSSPAWVLGVISGVLMIVVAFWVSGQFFFEKAYTLLVFAGIWAMLQGLKDIFRAFSVRALRDVL